MNNTADRSEVEQDPEVEAFLAAEDQKKRQHRKKTVIVFTIVIFILILAPSLFMLIQKTIFEYKLHAELAKIRASGDPSSEKELEIWYRNGNRFPKKGEPPLDINSNQNGAPLYLQAFRLLKDDVPYPGEKTDKKIDKNDYAKWYENKSSDKYINSTELIITGSFQDKYFKITPLPEKTVALNSIYLQANEPALEKAREAATKPFCIFPKILPVINSPLYQTLSSRRQLARLFSMHVRIYAEKGEIDKSIDALEYGIKLTDSFKKEPFLINFLVFISIRNMAYSNIEYLLNKVQLNDKQLKRISDIISKEMQKESFTSAFKGELLFCMTKEFEKEIGAELMRRILLGNSQLVSQWKLEPYGTFIARESGAVALGQRLHIHIIKQASDLPGNNYMKTKNFYSKLQESLPKNTLNPISSLITGSQMTMASYFKSIATQRISQTAVAIKRYKLKYKKLPDSLQELVPEFISSVPLDPFDNKPLKYTRRNVIFKQAIKMTEEEKSSLPIKDKQRRTKSFADIFNSQKPTEKNKENIKFNKPINGYKVIAMIKPCFLIYSIGEDLDDNGGTPWENYGLHTDITITIIDK